MEQLLFDDIPYLHTAQAEHARFAALLRGQGVEVVYLTELVTQVLTLRPALRAAFIEDVLDLAGAPAQGCREALREYLAAIPDAGELVLRSMAGVTRRDVFPGGGKTLSALAGRDERFLLPPIPNLYFTRDPFACVGRGVIHSRMFSQTRNRETVYGKYVLRYHPDFADSVPLYYTPEDCFSIEGGDVLNLSPRVLAIGISQRTQAEAIERLAPRIFADEAAEIDTILAVDIPHTRACMHLDTVFTQVDRDKFTVHPGIFPTLRIFELTGKGAKSVHTRELDAPLDQVLARALQLDGVQLIRCGGESEIASAREQWNDGSNTLCLEPGTVVVYDRNHVTNRALEAAGVRVLKIAGSELSRGRGGPRCMSMPLLRDAL